jgi:hypothetical protein
MEYECDFDIIAVDFITTKSHQGSKTYPETTPSI